MIREEIATTRERDPLNGSWRDDDAADEPELAAIRERVARAIERAARAPVLDLAGADARSRPSPMLAWRARSCGAGHATRGHQRRARATGSPRTDRVLLLGEDIRSPYGGAFKATRGLSDTFPDRVLNTPISEAGIVGVANGLALGGRRPIVEIMFGDFLGPVLRPTREPRREVSRRCTTAACRARSSYERRWAADAGTARRTVRTSRSISSASRVCESSCCMVARAIAALYRALRESVEPTLIVENKLLYRERADAPLPPGYEAFETAEPFPRPCCGRAARRTSPSSRSAA